MLLDLLTWCDSPDKVAVARADRSGDCSGYLSAIRPNFKTGKVLLQVAVATSALWEVQND